MTIKEQIMKAWAQDAEVELTTEIFGTATGAISSVDTKRNELMLDSQILYSIPDITDIRFVNAWVEFKDSFREDRKLGKLEPEPDILKQEWEVGGRVGPNGHCGYTGILSDGAVIATCIAPEYADAIAALPDALRALVMAKNKYDACKEKYPFGTFLHLMFTPQDYQIITDALNKAEGK
jgi:hypothetical protein